MSRRLRGIRDALGLSQAELIRRADINYTTWNNYERGDAKISIESALKLRSKTGVSLDYIYAGDCSHLPAILAERLDENGLRRSVVS